MDQQVKIRFENVGKVFHTKRQDIEALRDINFEVYDHDFVSFIGPSGCGKSTIIRMIDDIIKPSAGKITVNGYVYDNNKPVPQNIVRNLGFVFQSPNILPWMTVRQNIMFPLKIMKDKDPKWNKVVDDLLAMSGLTDYADSYPAALSGGMLQRVGVLRAMCYQPDIMLMDEPYGALDEITRQQLDIETMNIWEKLGQTTVFITHNVSEAVFVSSRVYVLGTEPGRVVDEVKIDLPRPRTPEITATKEFDEYVEYLTGKIGTVDLANIK